MLLSVSIMMMVLTRQPKLHMHLPISSEEAITRNKYWANMLLTVMMAFTKKQLPLPFLSVSSEYAGEPSENLKLLKLRKLVLTRYVIPYLWRIKF